MKESRNKTYAPVRQPPASLFHHSTFSDLTFGISPTEYPDPLSFKAADLAPPPPAPHPPDNLLLASTKNDELIVNTAWPYNGDPTDTVQIEIDGRPVDTAHTLADVDDGGSFTRLAIPLSAAARNGSVEGRHEINYVVTFPSGDEERGPRGSFYFTDYTEPGKPFLAELVFSDEVRELGVTPETLEEEGGVEFLPAILAGYSGLAPGDVITGVVNGAEETVDAITVINDVLQLRFLRTFIEAQGDGALTFAYKVQDRAGNVSALSTPVTLEVLLKGAIPDLAPPGVPAYDDDDDTTDPKVIDETDARETDGLKVRIPRHDGMLAGDNIYVLWGGGAADPIIGPFTLTDVAPDPVATIGVPYAAISDKWHADGNDADVPKAVNVHYRLERGAITVGVTPLPNTVQVNLHVAGGADPDPETPWHGNLGLPVLESAGGTENEIPMEDFDKDAKIVVPWFLLAPPTEPTFILDDIVIVHYGSEDLPPYTVTQPDIDAEELPPFVLAAAIIGRVGSGTVELSYSVSRALGAGRPNIVTSKPQEVLVLGSDSLPGEGTLPSGTMPEAEGTIPAEPDRLFIGRQQARDGTDFIIPEYKNQNVGDDITLQMEVYRFFVIPGHSGSEVEVTTRKVVISNITPPATGDTSVHLTETQLMRYDLPTQSLHAHITYTIKGAADPTIPLTSDPPLLVDLDPRGD